MPKISVWLTSYNHGEFIGECIESILAQTYKDFELIITDDCSTDESWNIIEQYSRKDTRIRAVRRTYNYGSSGLETRLNEINGEYVAIIHCDDAWMPDKLEKQLKVMEENSNVTACFTLVNVIDDQGNILDDEKHQYHHVFNKENRTRYEWLNYFFYNGNCLCHPSLLIRKSAYTEMGILTKGLHAYPDYCQWIRLCKQADIYILQEKLTKFSVHGDGSNTSGENLANIKRGYTEGYFVLKEYLSLIDSQDFIEVFPEAKAYIVNGRICHKYAFAQILLSNYQNSYKLLGFELLYELFNDSKSEREILELYGYTRKKYNADKQRYDVFNVIPKARVLEISIYLNGNNGYNEFDRITQNVFIQHTGAFAMNVDLSDYSERVLGKIRIDLDEKIYRKFKITKCTCNNQELEIIALNGIKESGWEAFYTMDPQYELKVREAGVLRIEGYVEEITTSVVEQHFCGIQQQCNVYQQQCNAYQHQCEELIEEITRMKNTKIWRIRDKIRHLLEK